MAKAFTGAVADLATAPLFVFFDKARETIPPWRATTDELLEALTRAVLGE